MVQTRDLFETLILNRHGLSHGKLQMLIFLETLDSEHASSAVSVKVKMSAMIIDVISFEKSAHWLLPGRRTGRRCRCKGSWLCLSGRRSSWSNSSKLIVCTVVQEGSLSAEGVVSVRLQCCDLLRGVIFWSISKMGQNQVGNVQAFVHQDPALGSNRRTDRYRSELSPWSEAGVAE